MIGLGLGLQYNRGFSGGFTPADISTALWLKGSDTSTITQSGGKVSRWADKSGNGRDLIQNTIGNQPTTGVELINGLNALSFDGVNDSLSTITNPFGSVINDAFVFVVLKTKSISAGTLFSLSENDSEGRWATHAPWSNGVIYFDVGGTSGGKRLSVDGIISNQEVWMGGWNNSVTDSVQEIWKNGNKVASDNTAVGVNVSGNISVGGTNVFQHCLIAEFVLVNGVLSLYERQKMEGYLAWEYGLTANLPVTHPYKLIRP